MSTVPTLAQRAMVTTGDFSPLGVSIFDPASVTGGLRNAFPGNRIPASRLDPASAKVINLWPAPQTSAGTRNFIFNPTLSQRTDQFDARPDQNIGNSDRLFFKYSYDDTYLISPAGAPAAERGSPHRPVHFR